MESIAPGEIHFREEGGTMVVGGTSYDNRSARKDPDAASGFQDTN